MTIPDQEGVEVVCCQGPPQCLFQGDEAIRNAQQGCPLCRHIVIEPDGSEYEYQVPAQ